MQKLKITKSAYRFIKKESFTHDTETGGLLIGTLNNPIVIKASRAGVNAKVTAVSYSNDTQYDNQVLQQAIKKSNGKCKKIGYWHLHPAGCTHPSLGDLHQARKIVKGNEDDGDTRPVFFVIANVDGEVRLFGYSLKPGQKNFGQVAIEIINDDSKEIENALHREPTVIQPREMDFWKDHFQFYLTPNGYKRLKEEVDCLKQAGYDVNIYTRKQLCLKIKKEEIILCYLPPEYPLNPPRLFRGNREIRYCIPIWNSSYRIIDILNRLNRLKHLKRRLYESHNSKTNIGWTGFARNIRNTIKSIWNHTRTRRIDLRF
jgi:integrative and conjugative element protein (TIGR02256 family)